MEYVDSADENRRIRGSLPRLRAPTLGTKLYGRVSELAELDRLPPAGLVAIVGPRGIGKSALVVDWTRSVSPLIVDLNGFFYGRAVLALLAGALNVPLPRGRFARKVKVTDGVSLLAEAVARAVTEQRRSVLLLDADPWLDALDQGMPEALELQVVLRAAPRGVVTATRAPTGDGAALPRLKLERIDDEAARAWLLESTPATELRGWNAVSLRRILDWACGRPDRLARAAEELARPDSKGFEWLVPRLPRLGFPLNGSGRAAVDSGEGLDTVVRVVADLPEPIPTAVILAASGCSSVAVRAGLESLRRNGLVDVGGRPQHVGISTESAAVIRDYVDVEVGPHERVLKKCRGRLDTELWTWLRARKDLDPLSLLRAGANLKVLMPKRGADRDDDWTELDRRLLEVGVQPTKDRRAPRSTQKPPKKRSSRATERPEDIHTEAWVNALRGPYWAEPSLRGLPDSDEYKFVRQLVERQRDPALRPFLGMAEWLRDIAANRKSIDASELKVEFDRLAPTPGEERLWEDMVAPSESLLAAVVPQVLALMADDVKAAKLRESQPPMQEDVEAEQDDGWTLLLFEGLKTYQADGGVALLALLDRLIPNFHLEALSVADRPGLVSAPEQERCAQSLEQSRALLALVSSPEFLRIVERTASGLAQERRA